MNDLLNSLLDRTIASGPSIRPRLPSAYEPAGERVERLLSGPGDLAALEVFLETDASLQAPAAESVSTPKSELPKSQPAKLDHVEQAATPRLPPRAQAAAEDVPPEVQVIREIVANVTQPQLTNRRDTTLDPQPVDASVASLLSPPRATEKLLEPQVQKPEPTGPRSHAEVVEERDIKPQPPREGPREIKARVYKVPLPDKLQQKTALETTEPVHDEPAVLEIPKQESIAQARVQPRLEPKIDYATRPQLKSERTLEQLVNITIGRVEVRATQVSPPRSRSEKPTTTSLDDYLRSRAPAGRGAGL